MPANRFICFIPLSCLILLLSGCIGATPPSKFYLLETISESGDKAPAVAQKTLVALGPVRIPRYVDRPQIVSASARNAYQLSELNRWAEALDDNISRVLAQNLSLLAPVETVLVNSSNRAKLAPIRVSVNVLEFHVNPEGQAGLTAQWQILQGENIVQNRQASYRSPASTTDYAVMVAALNDCLDRMSTDLAASLVKVLADKN